MSLSEASIVTESRDRYLTYALSVVSGRALPDVRDGLKPVQRRILYAMFENLGLKPTGSHRKSAAVVGEVLAKFHPHGDSACYDAMVRMAQDFSLRYPLVDGQGNFGSLDGDNAAAYRYTEARLTAIALDVIGEIDQETVDFRANFDATIQEPIVFPSRLPNLLMNGASGIAVGMATSIPPHNLRDLVRGLVELIDDPEISNVRLVTAIKGPDFPTGCSILNPKKELDEIYSSGRGSIRMRSTWEVEEMGRGKRAIIINTIPYAANKAQIVEKIADLIVTKKLPQLNDVRDESTDTVRIVLELASGAEPEVAMAYLFKHTPLESNFAVNLTVIAPNERGALMPVTLSLKGCLQSFIDFRQHVVERRLAYEKKKLLERVHILEGLVKIFDALDEAIKIIRKSSGRSDSAEKLKQRFKLSEIQAYAVVDMRIYQLSKTSVDEIRAELEKHEKRINEITKLLKNKNAIRALVRSEISELGERYGDKRRCQLLRETQEMEFRAEDYVVHEDVYAIVTRDGWIKRIRQANELSTTRLRDGDAIEQAHSLSTVDSVLFFSNLGQIYSLRVSDFPASSGYGNPIQKSLKFRDGEKIVKSFALPATQKEQAELIPAKTINSIDDGATILMASKRGLGFALKLSDLREIKRNGRRVMSIREGDELVAVDRLAKNIALITHAGYGLVIEGKEVPTRDGPAVGVQLIGVRDEDALVAMIAFDKDRNLKIEQAGGKIKEVSSADLVRGRRALKGNKVGVKGEIEGVSLSDG